MYVELLALCAALSFAITAMFLKKGYKYSSPLTSALVVLFLNSVILWTISILFVPLDLFFERGALLFAVGGLFGQGIARTFRYISIDKIGTSITYIIIEIAPLISAVLAVAILGEKISFGLGIGTLLIIGGVGTIFFPGEKIKNRLYLTLPFAAAIIYGFVVIVHKIGLSIVENTIVGATAAVSSAFVSVFIYAILSRKIEIKDGKGIPYFIGAGIFNSLAFLLNFAALKNGNVTVVMPLLGTQPLFVIILSYLFLRDVEKISWKLVLGAIAVVSGAAVISIF